VSGFGYPNADNQGCYDTFAHCQAAGACLGTNANCTTAACSQTGTSASSCISTQYSSAITCTNGVVNGMRPYNQYSFVCEEDMDTVNTAESPSGLLCYASLAACNTDLSNPCNGTTPCNLQTDLCDSGYSGSAGFSYACPLTFPSGAIPQGNNLLCYDTQLSCESDPTYGCSAVATATSPNCKQDTVTCGSGSAKSAAATWFCPTQYPQGTVAYPAGGYLGQTGSHPNPTSGEFCYNSTQWCYLSGANSCNGTIGFLCQEDATACAGASGLFACEVKSSAVTTALAQPPPPSPPTAPHPPYPPPTATAMTMNIVVPVTNAACEASVSSKMDVLALSNFASIPSITGFTILTTSSLTGSADVKPAPPSPKAATNAASFIITAKTYWAGVTTAVFNNSAAENGLASYCLSTVDKPLPAANVTVSSVLSGPDYKVGTALYAAVNATVLITVGITSQAALIENQLLACMFTDLAKEAGLSVLQDFQVISYTSSGATFAPLPASATVPATTAPTTYKVTSTVKFVGYTTATYNSAKFTSALADYLGVASTQVTLGTPTTATRRSLLGVTTSAINVPVTIDATSQAQATSINTTLTTPVPAQLVSNGLTSLIDVTATSTTITSTTSSPPPVPPPTVDKPPPPVPPPTTVDKPPPPMPPPTTADKPPPPVPPPTTVDKPPPPMPPPTTADKPPPPMPPPTTADKPPPPGASTLTTTVPTIAVSKRLFNAGVIVLSVLSGSSLLVCLIIFAMPQRGEGANTGYARLGARGKEYAPYTGAYKSYGQMSQRR